MTAALALWLALAPAAPNKPAADDTVARDVTGTYAGRGKDVNGGEYETTVRIEEEGNAFRVSWNSMGQKYVGVGIRSGSLLSVGWAGQSGQDITLGVMVYEVQKDGALEGKWTMLGAKGKVRTESLKPVKPTGME